MPYLPADLAQVSQDEATAGFWEACRKRELRFQRCSDCARFRHPPLPGCPACGSPKFEWARVAGSGTVFSYTVAYHAVAPGLAGSVPYNVIVVEFEDAPGVRLVSNLVGTEPNKLAIGLPVELVWEPAGEGLALPRFRRT